MACLMVLGSLAPLAPVSGVALDPCISIQTHDGDMSSSDVNDLDCHCVCHAPAKLDVTHFSVSRLERRLSRSVSQDVVPGSSDLAPNPEPPRA